MFERDDPSPGERRAVAYGWPNLLLLPALMGALHATTYSLLVALFLGEAFGFSGGRPAPWPGAIMGIWLASFWTTRALDRWVPDGRIGQAISSAAWAATLVAWFVAEPVYREARIWSDPGSLVQGNAYLVPPLLISVVLWWQGIRYATDQSNLTAEETRGTVQRSWLVMGGSILLAILVVEGNAADALDDARIAVPLLLIVSLALVAAAELETTRRIAIRRGGQPPGWERWGRLASGLSVIVLVITAIVLTLLGPDVLNAVIAFIYATVRLIGIAVGYTIYAVIFAIYQLILGLVWGLEQLFGDLFGPISLPQSPPMQLPTQTEQMFPEQQTTERWEYAILLRWVVLGLGIAVIAFLLFRIGRRFGSAAGEGVVEEERDNVFSGDLARRQLRDLLRRGQRDDRITPLDLDGNPASVREVMRYLETLAGRQGVGRRQAETSTDFLERLRAAWSGVAPSLLDFNGRYQRIRYGEYPDTPEGPEYRPSLRDWTEVWRRRKVVETEAPLENNEKDSRRNIGG